MTRVTLNRDFFARLDEADKRLANDLAAAFTTQIEASIWPWPRGENPRDIVDTGALRDSQVLDLADGRAVYVWGVDYAVKVHEGSVSPNGAVLPARRWTASALQSIEAVDSYRRGFYEG